MMNHPEPAVENVARVKSEPTRTPRRADGVLAFEQIMRQYNQRLYRLAFSLLGEESEAEDVLQESYLRAFQRHPTFAGNSSVGAWLASIVRNVAIDHLRARRARQAKFTLEADLPYADDELQSVVERVPSHAPQHSPETSVVRDEMRDALEQAILALPVQFRAVFMLREVEGLTVHETAEYLQVAIATVKTRDHRARMLLRKKLGEQVESAAWHVFEFLGARCDGMVARVMKVLSQ
jgi:RNA polymerase sigma-70 factor, ECF subfamily